MNLVKIYGIGPVLEEGREYEVTPQIAEIIVSAGRATFELQGEEVVPPKEKEKVQVDIAPEKVQVKEPKKVKRGKHN